MGDGVGRIDGVIIVGDFESNVVDLNHFAKALVWLNGLSGCHARQHDAVGHKSRLFNRRHGLRKVFGGTCLSSHCS